MKVRHPSIAKARVVVSASDTQQDARESVPHPPAIYRVVDDLIPSKRDTGRGVWGAEAEMREGVRGEGLDE